MEHLSNRAPHESWSSLGLILPGVHVQKVNSHGCPGRNFFPDWSGLGHPLQIYLSYYLRVKE